MRRFIWLVSTIMLFITMGLSVHAQDGTPADQAEIEATLHALIDTAESAAIRAEEAAQLAQESSQDVLANVDFAFNLLGLFEAFSVILAIIAAALSYVGFNRVFQAAEELANTRGEVAKQLENLKKQFDEEVEKQRKEAEDLQDKLEHSAEERRITTERALLAQAYIPLGERQYKAQDYSGSISTYQQSLDLDPNNPVIHYRLGYVYTQQGDLDKAQYHYETASSLADNFAPAMAGLGYVIRRQGEKLEDGLEKKEVMNKAEQLLLKAMELSPKLVDDDGESWWGILGGLYRRRGQIDDAIFAYKQATIVTPQSSYGFGNLALLYMQKNQRDEMLTTYAEVEKLSAAEAAAEVNNYWGHADLVVSRYALGKSDLAAEVLERAIQIAPIESPYMLDGLQGTLEDLAKVLTKDKIPSIEQAIQLIKDEQIKRNAILEKRRAEEAKNTTEDKTEAT
jgi:tetratricopeptide (TPR) repeat protein